MHGLVGILTAGLAPEAGYRGEESRAALMKGREASLGSGSFSAANGWRLG